MLRYASRDLRFSFSSFAWRGFSKVESVLLTALWGVLLCVPTTQSATAQDESPGPRVTGESGPAEDAPASPGASNEAEAVDPFDVPEGTPEQLLDYLKHLRNQRPAAMDYEGIMGFQEKLNRAMATAADRILAANPTPGQAQIALRTKMVALSMLERLGDEQAGDKLAKVPDELKAAGMVKLAHEAAGFLLGHRLRHSIGASREAMEGLIGEVKEYLGASPGQNEAHLAIMAAQVAEYSGNAELAEKTYLELGQLLAKSDDQMVADLGEKMEGAARRMGLVGNTLEISGTTLGGQELDWSQYKGKAVLVVFWATWCGPCRAEIPNIRDAYEAYHDRGFEVLAINCDEERQAVEDFLASNPVPWPVLFSDDPDARGMDNPMAQKYGIMAIPATFFVGKSGKVLSLQARGPALRELLAEQYGPADESPTGTEVSNGDAAQSPTGSSQ